MSGRWSDRWRQRASMRPVAPACRRSVAATADRLPATRAAAVGGGPRRAGQRDPSLAADHLRLRQDVHLLHRALQPRPGAQPPVRRRRSPRRARSRERGYREVTLLGQNVNSYGHDLPPEPRFADVHGRRDLGRRLDLDGRPDIAALLRAIDGLRTADGGPPSRACASSPRIPGTCPTDSSRRWPSARPSASTSTCRSSRATTPVLRRMGRQYTVDAYLGLVERLRRRDPGHQPDDRRHRRLLRRDRRAVRGHARRCCARSASTRSSRPPSRRAGHARRAPRRRRPRRREAAPAERAAGAAGGDRPRAQQRWVGRTTEVLVERSKPDAATIMATITASRTTALGPMTTQMPMTSWPRRPS